MVHPVVAPVRRLCLALLAAAACERPAVSPSEPQSEPEVDRPAAEIASTANIRIHEPDGAPARTFGLYDAGELWIEVAWSGSPPADRGAQILDVYSPDGVVYRSERVPSGSPRCVLPVAGTNITRHGLSGRWSAELRFERGGAAVAVAEFELLAQSPTPE
jgi:hypothetical protein